MTREDYITEETRELLEQCGCPDVADNLDDTETYITQTQALRWIRRAMNIYIIVKPLAVQVGLWSVNVYKKNIIHSYDCVGGRDYEEATEKAIQAFCKSVLEKRNNMKQYVKPDINTFKLTPV